jgi:pimeloyl-ACP methyl ester carboxylesterase
MPYLALSQQINLYYLDENLSGQETALLLHGLGADSTSWQLQIPALASAGFRVLAPDSPGFGRSSPLGSRLRCVRDLTAFIPEFLSLLSISAAHIIGISMGGTQALQLALDWPKQIKKLVLVNTYARLDFSNPRLWPYYLLRWALIHTFGLPAQARAVSKRIFPKTEQEELRRMLIAQILQVQPAYYRAAMHALAGFNVSQRLCEVVAPTLIVTAEEDTTVPPSVQRMLVERIPNARQVVIPHAGHAVSVEQPEQFNQILLDFLLE